MLAGAAGCFLTGVAIVLSGDARWTDKGIIGLLFVGVLCLILAIVVLFWPKRRVGRDDQLAAYLATELQTGHAIRDRARMAHTGSDELQKACQEFGVWALAVNEWVLAHAPIYYADLPQAAPWAFVGKASALHLMDERLRAHTALAKKLGGLEA